MASANGEEEYESDPEEAKLSLALRRRVASDDEEEEGDEVVGDVGDRRGDEMMRVSDARASDEESDDLGAPEDSDEEEMGKEEELEEEGLVKVQDVRRRDRERAIVDIENEFSGEGKELLEGGVADGQDVQEGENQVEGEKEKKEHEPFAVPTAGAFYMHDDRFRDSTAGRNRRTLGARKLWESKDERKWGHDKFEEWTSQDSPYNESRRNSKGHHRGRGRNQGIDRGFVRGNRSKMPEDDDNQAPAPTVVRGRGPRRYDPAFKHRNEVPQTQNKQSGKYLEKSSNSNSATGLPCALSVSNDALPAKKNLAASNLNSASPPFYPSGTSKKDLNLPPKKNVQPANNNRNPQTSPVDENLATIHTNTMLRGKGVGNSFGMNKLYHDDTVRKPSNSSQVQPSGFTNPSQGPQVRNQTRGQEYPGHLPSRTVSHPNHASKVSGSQLHATQVAPLVQNRTQSYSQSPAQPTPKQIGNKSQASSSPPRGYAFPNSFGSGEESLSESGKAKTAIVGKAAGNVQVAPGPFMYNGTQIMGPTGNMGAAHGDHNFPTFLPVMQIGAQQPGGIGVPALGMAFPGYVQPRHGQGSSEMTWLPVLAGAAGALGATYCPPYMLNNASYNPQLSGQQFTASSSIQEANTNKATNEWNPSQKLEHAGEEFEQRQSKPRRYSEMKFDH